MPGDPDGERRLAAHVVLRPADRAVDVDEPITSATVARHLPDPTEAEDVRRTFASFGFEVGPLVGIGFSIEAPPATFLAAFGTGAESALRAAEHQQGASLSPASLPPDVGAAVLAIEITPPPDFGPGAP